MICARCDEPIRSDEEYDKIEHQAPTGPGATFYTHKKWCRRPPRQTYPLRRWYSR